MSAAAGAGMTPTEVRLRVLANGWRPLPVAGKAPTPTDWSRYCRAAPTDGEVAFWGRSHPGAASTGLAMGAQAAIDIDVISDPLRAQVVRGIAVEVFGPTPFERVGRAPKTALLYRAGPDIVSIHRKAADGSEDGVDILADGCQVVGFGLHKETRQPYAWTGEASPLDARPDAAPVITAAQVDTFLDRVEAVMPLHGGGASPGGTRKGGGKGSSEEIVRGPSGLVVNGRERFLTSCVWRAANALHQAKADLALDVLTDDAWELFTHPGRGADLTDGKWKKADAAYKAKLTLRRIEDGKVDPPGHRTGSPDDCRPRRPARRGWRQGGGGDTMIQCRTVDPMSPRCGARTRQGGACGQLPMANGRCRFHGGLSTGPRTPEGLERMRAAKTIHGGRAADMRDFRRWVRQLRADARRTVEAV